VRRDGRLQLHQQSDSVEEHYIGKSMVVLVDSKQVSIHQ
jgi:hypothetical protein